MLLLRSLLARPARPCFLSPWEPGVCWENPGSFWDPSLLLRGRNLV